mgnify:FL=1
MKKNLLLIFVSLFIVVIVVEIFLRFFLPQELTSPFRVIGKDGLILNIKNDNAVHFYKKRRTTYKFGEYHNRIYDFKEKEKKILVLGDSFTFGWLLNDEDTYIYKLNKNFNDYFFINAAAGGWGTSDHLKYLMEYCNIIKPNFIIIFINGGDISRSKRSNLFYMDKDNKIQPGQNITYSIEKLTENFLYKIAVENSHLLNFLRKEISRYIYNKQSSYKYINQNKKKDSSKIIKLDKINDQVKITKDINKNLIKSENFIFEKKLFLKIKEEIKKCNSQLILINLGWGDYNIDIDSHFLKEKNFFDDNSIKFIDLINEMEFIRNNKEQFMIKGDGHPNELANQIIYKLVSNKIKNLID